MTRDRFKCLDCETDTDAAGEYYMLHDEVWNLTGVPAEAGMLCIGCAETRIGRELSHNDFTDCFLNREWSTHSARLRERLLGVYA